jgi:hypothetical protein
MPMPSICIVNIQILGLILLGNKLQKLIILQILEKQIIHIKFKFGNLQIYTSNILIGLYVYLERHKYFWDKPKC